MNDSSHLSGDELKDLLAELFPICRSITGDGVRLTLRRLQAIAEFDIVEIPSGTQAFDWEVPLEWRVHAAYVARQDGSRIVDFQDNNLHLVSYSAPFRGTVDYQTLVQHLHSIPDRPDAIPYRTSYYRREWGFCIAHTQLAALDPSAQYEVVVDTELFAGALTLGEAILKGDSGHEYIVHTYCCHPSMGNDNLSGVVLWALLLRQLRACRHRHTYRFVIAPETIGTLAYLSRRKRQMANVDGAFVLSTVAGPGAFCLKRSFLGTSSVDRAARLALVSSGEDFSERAFDVFGSDERQYSSPGFRIPAVTISRSQYHQYPEYHTSKDDLAFVSVDSLLRCLKAYRFAIDVLEQDAVPTSLSPCGEPMLGRRGLYPQLGGASHAGGESIDLARLKGILWTAFSADGAVRLSEIAERRDLRFDDVLFAARELERQGLLKLEACRKERL